jgi:transposase-like protein
MLSVVKTADRLRARQLRREEGRSIKDIARRLNVAPSSVSSWVRDIELTPEQHDSLRSQNDRYDAQLKGRASSSAKRRLERMTAQLDGRRRAHRDEPLHVAGCMLYWAEGSKARNQVTFTNADPEVVRFFVRFLKTYFDLEPQDIKVTCNLFADHASRQREIERFWLDALGLSAASLCASTVNTYSKYSQKKRTNKLPYGTCRVVVSRTSIVQSIYGAIQEYAGFDRPEWLDC